MGWARTKAWVEAAAAEAPLATEALLHSFITSSDSLPGSTAPAWLREARPGEPRLGECCTGELSCCVDCNVDTTGLGVLYNKHTGSPAPAQTLCVTSTQKAGAEDVFVRTSRMTHHVNVCGAPRVPG